MFAFCAISAIINLLLEKQGGKSQMSNTKDETYKNNMNGINIKIIYVSGKRRVIIKKRRRFN